jgi:putative ABC transport system permease protein
MSGSPGGGLPARRAVIRWSWRLFRREWRQQVLVLLLLTTTVAAAVLGTAVAYNLASRPSAEFGEAEVAIDLSAEDPAALRSTLALLQDRLGPTELIGRSEVEIPGSVERLQLRAQDPAGPYGAGMLARRSGRYPTSPDEVALTAGTARSLAVQVGDRVRLGGTDLEVVGVVENPDDLDEEFALLEPAAVLRSDAVTVLLREDTEQIAPLLDSVRDVSIRGRDGAQNQAAAVGALAAAAVVLLMVGLVSAAGFVVVAQRRSRQLGMLAATGAADRHLRVAVLAHGAAVGLVAGVAGAAVGLLGWMVAAPRFETVANHRIQRFDLPWPMIAASLALAVLTATAAAWWPARVVSRAPVTEALSGRPPTPRPAHRSAIVAIGCIVAGTAGLAFGMDTVHDEANPLLVLLSIPLLVLGLLLISPLAIGALAACGSRLPVAPRLALRDLGRFRARSGTALAAISLSLGLAMAIVLAATAAQAGSTEGNLTDHQVLFRIGGGEPFVPVRSPEEVVALEDAVARFAATLDESGVLALDAVADPAIETFEGHDQHPIATLAWPVNENTNRDIDPLYVATPELARRLDIDLSVVPGDTDVLTGSDRSELFIVNVVDPTLRDDPVQTFLIPAPAYSSVPAALMTPAAMERHGLVAVRSGWLVDAAQPLTDAQRDAARRIAASAGLTAEVRDEQGGLGTLRQSATAAGALFALGVLAMTVGLIRSESGRDLRTLTASGATSTTRRTLTAATAGGLALLGAVLGTAVAYLALGAGYSHELGQLTPMPVPEVIAVLIGLPLLATASGWLLAGREPDALGRAAID